MIKIRFLAVLMLVLSLPPAGGRIMAEGLDYPETKKVGHVDDYFGTKVADPYRWLEDDNAGEVKEWVEAQNRLTFSYLDKIPCRDALRKRITGLINYPKYSSPYKAGEYYFFYKNDGLQNQSVIYIQKGLDGEPEVFIDPNLLSEDATVKVHLGECSRDNRYVAVLRSEAGSDWQEIRVMEIATRKELEDRVQWVKFSDAQWYGDGFFYSAYDKPVEGDELKGQNTGQKVMYHRLGQPQEKDELIYSDPDKPLMYFWAAVTEDQKYLLLYKAEGSSGNEVHYRELGSGAGPFLPLVEGFENDCYVVENTGGGFILYTTVDAPNGRVVMIDPDRLGRSDWKTLIPEGGDVLSGVTGAGGRLFCEYLRDASSRIAQHDLSGAFVREIDLPMVGSAGGFNGKREDLEVFYTFTSFTYPPTIFRYDIASGRSEVFRRTEVGFDVNDFEAKQVFYTSKDGTRVPMFLIHKKGLELDGRNPVFLYGYGGFNISMTPNFSASRVVLVENGCVIAVPNLRGGGEYGETWHKAGSLLVKQNTFDDFIAAAEYLIAEKYTSPDRIAISGGSNGGLLVGACMVQRPDLFRVALPSFGVLDMLRYHKFTIGWSWAGDYGSSDNEEQFRYLLSYSPLHNVKKGVSYPATLVTTADHDDRVVPAHSFKFIAELQEKHDGDNPVLIRVDVRSGHGSSNTTKMIEEFTDEVSFMFHNIGIDVK